MSWCWHTWKVVEKVEQPAKAEIANETGVRIKASGSAARESLVRPVVVTYRCAKCAAEKVTRV